MQGQPAASISVLQSAGDNEQTARPSRISWCSLTPFSYQRPRVGTGKTSLLRHCSEMACVTRKGPEWGRRGLLRLVRDPQRPSDDLDRPIRQAPAHAERKLLFDNFTDARIEPEDVGPFVRCRFSGGSCARTLPALETPRNRPDTNSRQSGEVSKAKPSQSRQTAGSHNIFTHGERVTQY